MTGDGVSVIIPTYRRQAMLERAVRSVLVAAPAAEVIVVDDASPDPISPPPGARILRLHANVGAAGARNAGVEASSGDIITFLDSDDTWHPARIRKTVPHLAEAPIVVCWTAWMTEKRPRGRRLYGDVSDTIANAMVPQVGSVTLLRSIWEPFDLSYRASEDIEWWIRIAQKGHVYTVPEALCLMERHDEDRHLSGADKRIESSWRLLETPYFQSHRRARAFRLRRIAVMARSIGDHASSSAAFRSAAATLPTPAALARMTQALLASEVRNNR